MGKEDFLSPAVYRETARADSRLIELFRSELDSTPVKSGKMWTKSFCTNRMGHSHHSSRNLCSVMWDRKKKNATQSKSIWNKNGRARCGTYLHARKTFWPMASPLRWESQHVDSSSFARCEINQIHEIHTLARMSWPQAERANKHRQINFPNEANIKQRLHGAGNVVGIHRSLIDAGGRIGDRKIENRKR